MLCSYGCMYAIAVCMLMCIAVIVILSLLQGLWGVYIWEVCLRYICWKWKQCQVKYYIYLIIANKYARFVLLFKDKSNIITSQYSDNITMRTYLFSLHFLFKCIYYFFYYYSTLYLFTFDGWHNIILLILRLF